VKKRRDEVLCAIMTYKILRYLGSDSEFFFRFQGEIEMQVDILEFLKTREVKEA